MATPWTQLEAKNTRVGLIRKAVKETHGEGCLFQAQASRTVIKMETGRYQWRAASGWLFGRPTLEYEMGLPRCGISW